MSWKDQARRRHAAEKRGRRGVRRAGAMLLRQLVLHPVAGAPADDEPAPEAVIDEQEAQPRIKSGATEEGDGLAASGIKSGATEEEFPA